MAIPTYEQRITPDAPQASVPEELHPVAAAFGGDIGKALESGGDAIQNRVVQLASHMATMNYYRGEAQKQDLLTNYKTAQQDMLFNAEGTTKIPKHIASEDFVPDASQLTEGHLGSYVAPEGTIEVPTAILGRKGYQANGALTDFDVRSSALKNDIIAQARQQGLGERNIKSLVVGMDNAHSSQRMYIAKHEAEQLNQAQQQTFLKGMQLDADNSITNNDPTSLSRTIDSIRSSNTALNDSQGKAMDDPIRELTENKFVGQAVNNSINQIMKTTGSSDSAYDLLDKLHDAGKINDTVYTQEKDNVDKGSKVLQEKTDRSLRMLQTNGRMNLINQTVQGKVDWSNQGSLNDIAQNDPELHTAISNYIDNGKTSTKPDDQAFADAVEKVFKAGSKEQLSGYMTNILKENGGKISQDKLNILVGAAMDRGKNIADLKEDEAGHSKNPVQSAIDGGMKAIFGWNEQQKSKDSQIYADYMNYVKSKVTPSEAYKKSINDAIIRSNPEVASLPTTPNYVIGKDSSIRYVFPRTNRKSDGPTGTK